MLKVIYSLVKWPIRMTVISFITVCEQKHGMNSISTCAQLNGF